MDYNVIMQMLRYMVYIWEILLLKINVPREEAEAFSGKVKERHMGELFANFEAYDVQETRRVAREEGMKEGIVFAIRMMKEASVSREITCQQLIRQFGLSESEAEKRLQENW